MKNAKKDKKQRGKRPLPLRILIKAKNIVLKLSSRAWWHVLFIIAVIALSSLTVLSGPASRYALRISDGGKDLTETPLKKVETFSVNDKGEAAFVCNLGSEGMSAVLNVDSGKQQYANVAYIITDPVKNVSVHPYDMVITDENEIYALSHKAADTSYVKEDSIIRASADYNYKGEVCNIKYKPSQMTRRSKISKLHYYDGAVTFARVERDEVFLYSIDTETQAVSISKSYPTDRSGTYTAMVIPIDGAFLFFRSDGNVYKTKFDEPLEEVIYKYDIDPEGECDNFIFNKAVMCGGELYVSNKNHPTEVFRLEDGKLEKVLDMSSAIRKDESEITGLGSYRAEGDSEDTLLICFNNKLMAYKAGKLVHKNINIKLHTYLLYYIYAFFQILTYVSFICIIINLITRKKTLLYKQLITVVPVYLVLMVVIASKLYQISFNENNKNIEKDLGIICKLGAAEFEDYDFSPMLDINEDTGEAYYQLESKLEKLSKQHLGSWSDDYIFSVIYRKKDGSTVLLARNDSLGIPMYEPDEVQFNDEEDEDDLNAISDVDSFLSEGSRTSSICVYEKINDSDGCGDVYLKVCTEDFSYWLQRRESIFRVFLYCMLIFLIITALITATSLRITRTINKARDTVIRMKDGDLTARINYRSKDELGDICTQVNEMGQSLEELFEEKDKTERFYYKFVPEKFREFLGKESFTELSLGDASSRELTVLFCDIRSFSINSEIMTAKENFAFVNVVYGKAGPIIRRNNGFVDKYIGDAVMALFENADDAVRCGIELYRAIVLDPRTAEQLNVSDINIGIGIHSGMAMIGIVGESERLSGTVISDTVNLSSRLESLTKQYKTAMLISKDTVDRLTDPESLELRYLGIIQVAGVNEVKAVYEVLDCLPDEQRQRRQANSGGLREAVRLFHLGRRSDAAAALEEISKKGESDHVTKMYSDYIRGLSDDDKGNVFRFVRK